MIDSSASACSVCVTTDKVVTGHNYVSMDRGHASAIVPMIESTLKGAKTLFEELRFVAVTKGPGSFTNNFKEKFILRLPVIRCFILDIPKNGRNVVN